MIVLYRKAGVLMDENIVVTFIDFVRKELMGKYGLAWKDTDLAIRNSYPRTA